MRMRRLNKCWVSGLKCNCWTICPNYACQSLHTQKCTVYMVTNMVTHIPAQCWRKRSWQQGLAEVQGASERVLKLPAIMAGPTATNYKGGSFSYQLASFNNWCKQRFNILLYFEYGFLFLICTLVLAHSCMSEDALLKRSVMLCSQKGGIGSAAVDALCSRKNKLPRFTMI
jgi:hypothetical protein